MIKAYIKHLLSLCILLLSVYSQLYAHTFQDGIRHSSIKNLLKSDHASFGIVQNSQTQVLKFVSASKEKENHKIDAAEIEEEDYEYISFKKLLENSNYFATVFYALVFGCLGLFLSQRLLACKHALYFFSYKLFLLFRVIRI